MIYVSAYARKISCGTMLSIEWVHVTDLTVDHSYQRSIDNEPSRRLMRQHRVRRFDRNGGSL